MLYRQWADVCHPPVYDLYCTELEQSESLNVEYENVGQKE